MVYPDEVFFLTKPNTSQALLQNLQEFLSPKLPTLSGRLIGAVVILQVLWTQAVKDFKEQHQHPKLSPKSIWPPMNLVYQQPDAVIKLGVYVQINLVHLQKFLNAMLGVYLVIQVNIWHSQQYQYLDPKCFWKCLKVFRISEVSILRVPEPTHSSFNRFIVQPKGYDHT